MKKAKKRVSRKRLVSMDLIREVIAREWNNEQEMKRLRERTELLKGYHNSALDTIDKLRERVEANERAISFLMSKSGNRP